MKKILIATTALVALAAAPAVAADLAVKAPLYKAPPPVAYFSWTGCYVGGNVGGVWVNKDFALDGFTTPLGVGGPGFLAGGYGSHTASSVIGGVQGGCDYQFAGGFVIGIAGDYDWTGAKAQHADPFTPLLDTLSSNTTSLASVTARIGYAWDRFLGYVKGGGAWERDNYSWFNTANPAILYGSGSETRGGWTVGVGGEYAFTNWVSAFAEYDYYNFGTRTVGFTTPTVAIANFDIKETKSVFKVGLNFRWGAGPVVARY
jgi:outer membrane immunogenic protein